MVWTWEGSYYVQYIENEISLRRLEGVRGEVRLKIYLKLIEWGIGDTFGSIKGSWIGEPHNQGWRRILTSKERRMRSEFDIDRVIVWNGWEVVCTSWKLCSSKGSLQRGTSGVVFFSVLSEVKGSDDDHVCVGGGLFVKVDRSDITHMD